MEVCVFRGICMEEVCVLVGVRVQRWACVEVRVRGGMRALTFIIRCSGRGREEFAFQHFGLGLGRSRSFR